MWSNDIKCKCMFMFPLKNLACKGLIDHILLTNFIIPIPPASTKLKGGYTGITLSVCPSVDRIVSALYLQEYSSNPFHICTSYQATSEGVSCVMPISKLKNVKFWQIFTRGQFWPSVIVIVPVCVSVSVCVSITCLSARLLISRSS